MEEHGNAGQMPPEGASSNLIEQLVEAIDRIAVGLSQQNEQMYQDFQAQLHVYQQQLQRYVSAPQPAHEYRLAGVSMPTFSGKPTESVDDLIFRAKLYMEGNYAPRREFLPPDQQFRHRAEFKACLQYGSVEDYVRDFRRRMAQIREMSAMDQVDRCCDGLKSESCKEVMYLRCGTLVEAIAAAQAFERNHFQSSRIAAVLATLVIVRIPIARQPTVQHRWISRLWTRAQFPMISAAVKICDTTARAAVIESTSVLATRQTMGVSIREMTQLSDVNGVSVEGLVSSESLTVRMDTTLVEMAEISTSEMTVTPLEVTSTSVVPFW